jgi:pimeloyl-ACP methyl ester carboxylesterase
MPHITASDGCRLYYSDEGAGTPLLFLPGLTRTTKDFDYLMPHLDLNNVRVIRTDYRGRGHSEWADHTTYTIPQESADVLKLLDHLKIERAAIIGTSRGGLIAMGLALGAKQRLLGACLNDVGPELGTKGLDIIKNYVGKNPDFATHAEMADAMPGFMAGFANVPSSRWLEEVRKHYIETPEGLKITYDPKLLDALLAASGVEIDLWPFFDALDGLPIALIRGANSDLLTGETAREMRRKRPDMIFAEVPDRAHIPYLDEPESLDAIHEFLSRL